MKSIDASRKEDTARILQALKAADKAKAEALTKQWEVVRVTVGRSGLVQEVAHTAADEEEADRYCRLLKCFPPLNADYYYKPWGHPFKGSK